MTDESQGGVFADKAAARQAVWDHLDKAKLARFPFPPHGRIPNFAGAGEAAKRLFDLPRWRDAKRIKVNPDSPQRPVRIEALRRGIEVYVPTPRLRGGFKLLDPNRIPYEEIAAAASISGAEKWGIDVALADMPQLDAIVTGCVAVTAGGRRAGKGEGFSDIEYAILRELGHAALQLCRSEPTALQLCNSKPRRCSFRNCKTACEQRGRGVRTRGRGAQEQRRNTRV